MLALRLAEPVRIRVSVRVGVRVRFRVRVRVRVTFSLWWNRTCPVLDTTITEPNIRGVGLG